MDSARFFPAAHTQTRQADRGRQPRHNLYGFNADPYDQLTRTAPLLVERYAQRMIIENSIADGIDFFHMDALSSAVAMKVNCDLQLTLMASSLYRLLAIRIGRGYERAESRHLFQDFVNATAQVTLTESDILVRYQKRAHNPLLIAAGYDTTETRISWLGRKRLQLVFG